MIIVSPAVPVADYIINYKHISEDLCVNKDKPWMHCHGKCYLKKEIKKVLGEDNPGKKKTTLPVFKLKEYANYYRIGLLKKFYLKQIFQLEESITFIPKTFKGYLPDMIKPPPVLHYIY